MVKEKVRKIGTQYKTILGAPAITDNNLFKTILGAPHVLYDATETAGYVPFPELLKRNALNPLQGVA